jgi:hypothetical protein
MTRVPPSESIPARYLRRRDVPGHHPGCPAGDSDRSRSGPDSGAVFALSAIVRRAEPADGLGLEFTGLGAGVRQALWQFIQNGLPELDVVVAEVEPSDPGDG